MTKEALEALISKLEMWALIFGAVVVIGVGGESVFGIRIWWNNRKLHKLEQAENDDLRLKVRQADERSSGAEVKAESFRLKIADANERAALAEQHAAEANERAKGFEVEALRLRTQMAAQGSRTNLLTGEKRRNLVEALKPFVGQPIDVRRTANIFEVNGAVVQATPLGEDTVGLSEALVAVLKEAGWQVPSEPLLMGWQGYGINVWFRQGASARTQMAALALTLALRRLPLSVSGPTPVTKELTERVGTAVVSPPLTDETIILIVLTHP